MITIVVDEKTKQSRAKMFFANKPIKVIVGNKESVFCGSLLDLMCLVKLTGMDYQLRRQKNKRERLDIKFSDILPKTNKYLDFEQCCLFSLGSMAQDSKFQKVSEKIKASRNVFQLYSYLTFMGFLPHNWLFEYFTRWEDFNKSFNKAKKESHWLFK